jgi:hypothetical protein
MQCSAPNRALISGPQLGNLLGSRLIQGPWQTETSTFFVANLWTEFSAQRRYVMRANGKDRKNPNKLVVAATFEMAKT